MKTIFTLLSVLIPIIIKAQNYTIVPSSIINVSMPVEEYNGSQISFKNILNEPLLLEWGLLENNLVNDWDYSVCDYGQCYAGIPSGGFMASIAPGDSGFLKMNMFPMSFTGSGEVKFVIYDTDPVTDHDTVIFTYNVVPVGINTLNNVFADITVYPNPASEIVFIANINQAVSITIADVTGKVVIAVRTLDDKNSISVKDLPQGLYFVSVLDNNGNSVKRKLCIAR